MNKMEDHEKNLVTAIIDYDYETWKNGSDKVAQLLNIDTSVFLTIINTDHVEEILSLWKEKFQDEELVIEELNKITI